MGANKRHLFRILLTPGGSLHIFAGGLLVHLLSFPLLNMLTLSLQERPLKQMVTSVLAIIWFSLPLIGIFGIVIGVICYLRSIGNILPLLGMFANALWLAVYGLIVFFVIVQGISA